MAEHETLARTAAEAGDWATAIEHWDVVRRSDPWHGSQAHLGVALGLRALHEPSLALDALEFGIELFPHDVALRKERGRVLIELGFRRAAEVDFVEVARLTPADPLAWCDLAHLRECLREPRSAVEAYEVALALDGCPPAAVVAAARVHARIGRIDRAHALYRAAIDAAPEDALLLADAIEALGRARTLRPECSIQPQLAARAEDLRRWEARLVELDPVAVARTASRAERVRRELGRAARHVAVVLLATLGARPPWAAEPDGPQLGSVAVSDAVGFLDQAPGSARRAHPAVD